MRRFATCAAALLVAAACSGGGDSILESGNDPVATAVPTDAAAPETTAGEGSTTEPQTGASAPAATTAPAPTMPPTTTTTPLDALPPCVVDAIDATDDATEVLFWHGLTGETQTALEDITAAYNDQQPAVEVRLEPQGNYDETFDKYIQSGQDSRPDLVLFPEYFMQQTIDSGSVIPVGACVEASGFDLGVFHPPTIAAYSTAGVQWGMPFNISNPVLYYNRAVFEAAGLDPDAPPLSLDDLRAVSQAIVDSGAASYGIAIDSTFSAFGGWVIEQWFANAGEFYADNENGRIAPATQVLYDNELAVELLTFVDEMVEDGLAFYVGGNATGQDTFLKLADDDEPAAMTAGSSSSLSTVKAAIDGGLIPGATSEDIGVGPLPSPTGSPTALVGGASLYVVGDRDDATTSAVWDYVTFLTSAAAQSEWAARTGFVPSRGDALGIEPLLTTYAEDPRFRVAYDQLVGSPDVPTMRGPLLGPQREVRVVTARAVAAILEGAEVAPSLADAAAQADALIADYNARN